MRVHPSQLSNGILPFFGPSNLWVKSFNLNNKRIVFSICILFLISVIGTALTSKSFGNIKDKLIRLSSSNPVSDPLAVVLSNAEKKIFLLSAPTKQIGASAGKRAVFNELELSITDKIFLEEALKFGTLSVAPLSDAAELPLLTSRNVNELKGLLTDASSAPEATPVDYKISSRVFIPGQAEIYGITAEGTVVEIGANGKVVESVVE